MRNKVKGLLALYNLKSEDFAETLSIHKFSLSRKLKNNSFSIQDLLALAEITNTEITFVDKKNGKHILTLTSDDILDEADDREA